MSKNKIQETRNSQKLTLKVLTEKVNTLLKNRGILVNGKQLTINDGQLSKYENHILSPRHNAIWDALADSLGVEVSYLKGDSKFKNIDEVMRSIMKDVEPVTTNQLQESGALNPIADSMFNVTNNLNYLSFRLQKSNLLQDKQALALAVLVNSICTIFSKSEHDEVLLKHVQEIISALAKLSSKEFKIEEFAEVLGESSIAYAELYEYIKNKNSGENL